MTTLRIAALGPLCETDAVRKAEITLAVNLSLPVGRNDVLTPPALIPGRPLKPELIAHNLIKPKPLSSVEGRALLVHSVAHIELNAIDLALDVVWRFPGLPDSFYTDWMHIAQEEAKHFMLLHEHLRSLGYNYGDFAAHNALWEMAERTQHDVLARIGIVPRTMEARGLDASPGVKNKLIGAGDHKAGQILDIILEEEIGHVAAGNRWYRYLCQERGLEPVSTYARLIDQYDVPKLRPPFNMAARRLAGFAEEELDALL
jgi:uncharacterized ferritin-like protein (DUF455 family)